MKKDKKVFSLAKGNLKFLNGWNDYNERLWDSLTDDEKVLVNDILLQQMEHFLPHERMSFNFIVDIIKSHTDSEILTHEIIIKLIKDIYGNNSDQKNN